MTISPSGIVYTSSTRSSDRYSIRCISPRFCCASSMIGPMYSVGVSTVTLTYGSWIAMTLFESGIADGLSTTSTRPSSSSTRYSTFGAVATSDRSYSRSRRSRTISMCRSPRNPQRNPKPSAPDVSGSYVNDESLSRSFSSASRRSAYSSPSTG